MRILCSISYANNLPLAPGRYGPHEVDVLARTSDWGKAGLSKYAHYTNEAFRLLRQARGYDALALFTVSMEAFLLGRIKRLLRGGPRLVCADFLIPRPRRWLEPLRSGLQAFDAFICIRRGDAATLERRFGISPARCLFAPFPCDPSVQELPARETGYVYAAGWAHRDWPTLLRALEAVDVPAVLSVGGDLPLAPALRSRVRVLPQQSPGAGRALLADASLVVLPLRETELPSGPLVLLDAMVMGKAVIVTDVNGSRDYVTHGCTAWVVPPGDPQALKSAITELMQNPKLRRRLGQAARRDILNRCTTDAFLKPVLAACVRA
ncbi:MAG: glycosyltransferase family 4 protein [Verrucomicrobiota bacterium]